MTTRNLPTTAREGRDNQRYTATGERQVAGIVPLSSDSRQVLLIRSSRRPGWVLPKGGWETDEATVEAAAKREAWEEAGITVQITRSLGSIADERPAKAISKEIPKAVYLFFEAKVEKEYEDWPEKYKRGRKWMGWAEAREALEGRKELLEALERSSMKRDT